MPKELKLVSPAIQLAKQVVVRGLPESAEVEDAVNAAKYAGPRPTIYNVNTGEWDEESPWQGEQLT